MKLVIRNFRPHENITIDLTSAVTTLVGESDVGKTSAISALKWLCLNLPRGDKFITHGKDTATVALQDIDRHTVVRSIGKGGNVYCLDGEEYKAFGNNVPSEVESLLNVSEENFQGQHDRSFWFHLTGGELAQQLNRIVDLTSIDRALANVASALRKSQSKLEVSTERLEQARKERHRLKWTQEASEQLADLESVQAHIAFIRSRIDSVTRLTQDAKEYATTIQNVSKTLKIGAILLAGAQQIADKRQVIDELRKLCGTIVENEQRLSKTKSNLAAAERRLKEAMKGKCPVCGNDMSK